MNAGFKQVKEIFLAALERESPEARQLYLNEACAADESLRRQVEALLHKHEQAGSFLEPPPADPSSHPRQQENRGTAVAATIDEPVTERPGVVVGPYKLMEQIGEGGMGLVFVAEQYEPVRRKVALKLIKPGMDSREIIARFQAERQALALMDHPNIARVLDAGATSSGRPYFVMELVKGVPITQFCDENRLSPQERLELFTHVCHAVQHAHQKGIIHRDIKPSNVLVTSHDGRPMVKVIDFGVAKAVGQQLTERTLYTGLTQMVGTPLYMSPEQAGMSGLDIDTRTDIYSLGVLLYELLTGTTPFDKERLKRAAYDEMRRIIREEEPQKPSTRISTTDAAPNIAACRHTEPAKLAKMVRGDLDWIVMKALEKDRDHRYETANGIAADVLRYLADEPVLACPPSALYRFQKFARRNKAALATAAVVAAALLLGTAISTWQAIRATRAEGLAQTRLDAETQARKDADDQRTLAQQNATTAETQRRAADAARQEAVNQMLTRVSEERLLMVPQMEPVRKALLEDALKFYQGFLSEHSGDPAIRYEAAEAHRAMGRIHVQLGQQAQAEQNYTEAIELLEKLVDEFPSVPRYRAILALSNWGLGHTLVHLGRDAEAVPAYQRGIDLMQKLVDEGPAENWYRRHLAWYQTDLAASLQRVRHMAEPKTHTEESLRESLRAQEKLVADSPENPTLRYALGTLQIHFGGLLRSCGRPQEAEKFYQEAISVRRTLVRDFPHTPQYRAGLAEALHCLATLRAQNGRPEESDTLYEEVISHRERLVAEVPDRPAYQRVLAMALGDWGLPLTQLGRLQQAEGVLRRAIGLYEELDKELNLDQPIWRANLVNAHQRLGRVLKAGNRLPEALAAYQQAVGLLEKLVADQPTEAQHRQKLATLLQDLEAVELMKEKQGIAP